jgi:tRNA modification GTPase
VIDCVETIAAVATPPGRGGVAVVRVSGPGAFAVARALTRAEPEPGRIAVRRLLSPVDGATIDRAVVLAFRAPASYTGEDVVEFQCHGGSVTPRRTLDACFAAGARLARRGEFTERAFLNGRMDLSAAESVIELVDAQTDRAADDALARQQGDRTRAYRALYERAVALSAALEHALDVDDGDLPADFAAAQAAAVRSLAADVERAGASARAGRLLRTGALVVLAGAPNAGKSSLLNALLGTERAIVSDTPGTTRDTIEETLDVDGWPVRLVDTAGLRAADDRIEAEGVRRAEVLITSADVVLALDCEVPGALRLHAKCDLSRGEGLNVSSRTGEGLEALKAALAARLSELAAVAADGSATASERERSLLCRACSLLTSAAEDDLVLLANAVRAAADVLGNLVGAVYSDDLLEALFSRFCVGK